VINRTLAAFVAASLLTLESMSAPALAGNQMGYQLLSAEQGAALPRNGGKLGLNVGRAQQVNSDGLTFELLRVNDVNPGSSGAKAGFKPGDQIIAVDGKVFPSVAAFAAYVGSMPPAGKISIDYMPSRGGPQEAQRVNVTLGGGRSEPAHSASPARTGLSTGEKVAIGVGAAALFGCYKMGCFSHTGRPALGR